MLALILACADPPPAAISLCDDCVERVEWREAPTPTRQVERILVRARPELAPAFGSCFDGCPIAADWYDFGETTPDRWRIYVHGGDEGPAWLEVDLGTGGVSNVPQPWDPKEPASPTATNPLARAASLRKKTDVAHLLAALDDPAWVVRYRAVNELMQHADERRVVEALLTATFWDSPLTMDRWIRAGLLAIVPGGVGAVLLGDAPCDPEPAIRWLGLWRIAPHRDPSWVEPWMNDPDPAVAAFATALRHQQSDLRYLDFDPIYTAETSPAHPILAHMPVCAPTELRYRVVVWSPAVARAPGTATFTTEAGALAPIPVSVDPDGVLILDVPVPAELRMRSVTLRVAGQERTWSLAPRGATRVVGLCDDDMPAGGGVDPVDVAAWRSMEWAEEADCLAAAASALPTLPLALARGLANDLELDEGSFTALVGPPRNSEERIALLGTRLRAGPGDGGCAALVDALGAALDPGNIGRCAGAGPLTSAALGRSGADPVRLLRLLDAPDRAATEAALARRVLAGDQTALRALKLDKHRERGPVRFPTPADGVTGFYDNARCDVGPDAALRVDKVLVLPKSMDRQLPLRDEDLESIAVVVCGGRVRWKQSP